MRDDSNKAEATTAFKGNLILFCYHIKRREVLTFQPTTGLLHKHFELCFSIMQLCIPLIHMCIFHQIPSHPLRPPVHLPPVWDKQIQRATWQIFPLQKRLQGEEKRPGGLGAASKVTLGTDGMVGCCCTAPHAISRNGWESHAGTWGSDAARALTGF